jgi:hypothetical protein
MKTSYAELEGENEWTHLCRGIEDQKHHTSGSSQVKHKGTTPLQIFKILLNKNNQQAEPLNLFASKKTLPSSWAIGPL